MSATGSEGEKGRERARERERDRERQRERARERERERARLTVSECEGDQARDEKKQMLRYALGFPNGSWWEAAGSRGGDFAQSGQPLFE